jgi:pyruvate carboxylase
MKRAISDYQITGIQTTLSFGQFALNHPAFVEGHFDTKFIDTYFRPELLENSSENLNEATAYLSGYLYNKKSKTEAAHTIQGSISNWRLQRK